MARMASARPSSAFPPRAPRTDTAGLSADDSAVDRPGPAAPLEYRSEENEDAS